jgi:hypothetical protein
VIWTNLNAQSVCTYQIWYLLILWCSTSWEDSKDYKFVIFGWTELKIWIDQANRRFDPNLKIVSNWTHKIKDIIVLLDSRCSKDSNGILFVIFEPTDQKIWFFKVLAKFRFRNLFRLEFELEADTWLDLIGWYRFGRICTEGHRIKRWMDAPDHSIPLRLSDQSWGVWSRSSG